VGLVSRYLEENLIPTVVLGSAKDIVEHVGVSRFLFVDYPLGNPSGIPYDRNNQLEIVEMALNLLESTKVPNTTIRAPFDWPGNKEWRELYSQIRHQDKAALLAEGDIRRKRFSKSSPRKF